MFNLDNIYLDIIDLKVPSATLGRSVKSATTPQPVKVTRSKKKKISRRGKNVFLENILKTI